MGRAVDGIRFTVLGPGARPLGELARSGVLPRGVEPAQMVNVDISGRIAGTVELGEVHEDLIVGNFYAFLHGFLGCFNPTMRTTTDAWPAVRMLGDVNAGAVRLEDGTACTPETFADFTLTSAAALSTSSSFAVMADRMRFSFSASTSKSGCEVALFQWLIDTGARTFGFYYSRKVIPGGFAAARPIAYYIDLFPPWLRNFGLLLWGYLADVNVPGVFTVDGVSYTFPTGTGRVPSAPAVLSVGTSGDPFSFDSFNLASRVDLTTHLSSAVTSSHAFFFALGWFIPTSEYTIREIGITQELIDTGGTVRRVLLARIVLPTPVVAPAGRLTLVTLRWLAY